jgi:hypothetical protein
MSKYLDVGMKHTSEIVRKCVIEQVSKFTLDDDGIDYLVWQLGDLMKVVF